MDHDDRWIEMDGESSRDEVLSARVDIGFLDALEQPILNGRGFDARDVAENRSTVIVNTNFVEQSSQLRWPSVKCSVSSRSSGAGVRSFGDSNVIKRDSAGNFHRATFPTVSWATGIRRGDEHVLIGIHISVEIAGVRLRRLLSNETRRQNTPSPVQRRRLHALTEPIVTANPGRIERFGSSHL